MAAHAPDAGHYSCQTVIAPNGDMAPVFVTYNFIEHGETRVITRISDPSLDTVTVSCARARAAEGVRGPANVAFCRDRLGTWKVQEINLRNTGTTLGRFLLGMDELYLIICDFVPRASFPELHRAENDWSGRVGKHLDTYPLSDLAIGTLKETGIWSR